MKCPKCGNSAWVDFKENGLVCLTCGQVMVSPGVIKALVCNGCAGTGHILLWNTVTVSVDGKAEPPRRELSGVSHCTICKGTGEAPEV
jgi:hypothetical protein